MEGGFAKEVRWRSRLGMRKSGLPSAPDSEAPTAAPMAASNPWDPVQPTAAGTMLAHCLSTGVVSQVSLDTEILQMEKETADITHPFYLTQKSQTLQAMNRHLEALLKEKKALRQRLAKPLCQESLPIEAVFHRYAVELLALAVTFIEKLETHLTTVRSIPQIPLTMKNMDSALAKMDLLVTGTEKLAEQILQWRAKQKDLFSDSSQISAGSDSCFRSRTLE